MGCKARENPTRLKRRRSSRENKRLSISRMLIKFRFIGSEL
jgi:hypothetical protein